MSTQILNPFEIFAADGIPTDFIAFWPFNGNANDESGNGNNCTVFGATLVDDREGNPNSAFSFNGISDYIRTTNAIDLSSFGKLTISFWLNWATFSNDNDLCIELTPSFVSNTGGFIIIPNLSSSGSRFGAGFNDGGFYTEAFTRPSAGVWHNYTIFLDDTQSLGDSKMFVDSIEQSKTLLFNQPISNSNFANDILYFMSRGGTTLFGEGILDDIRIYPRELTQEEITALSAPPNKNLFYFIGESNSGGLALNADATALEIENNSLVQILNNTSLLFENLQIEGIVSTGKNNLIGHTSINEDSQKHGWELQLRNRAAEFVYPYLVKCGQGGSKLSQWDIGDPYDVTFKARSNTAKSIMSVNNLVPVPYVFMSIGLNDLVGGIPASTFYTRLIDWVGRVQTQTEAVKIFITTFDDSAHAGVDAYNTEIINAANAIDNLIRIDTTGATFQDISHWDYAGMKQICNSMLDLI